MEYNNKRPLPLNPTEQRKLCPVCGEASYSAAGIHPQCAVRQADPNHGNTWAQTKKKKQPLKTGDLQSWQKVCPACRAANHVRKKLCDCGHNFPKSNS